MHLQEIDTLLPSASKCGAFQAFMRLIGVLQKLGRSAVGLYGLALAGYLPCRYAAHRLNLESEESQPDVAQCPAMGFASGQGASDKERYLWLRMTRSFGK